MKQQWQIHLERWNWRYRVGANAKDIIGFVLCVALLVATVILGAILVSCTTVSSLSKSPDGTVNKQRVMVGPWGKSELAQFSTSTEHPMEGGGVYRQEMTTGAQGQTGSDLTALVDLFGLMSARFGGITPTAPEIVEPRAISTPSLSEEQLNEYMDRVNEGFGQLWRRLSELEDRDND